MKQFWRNLVCIFTHSTVERMVPIDCAGGLTAYRLLPLCPQCDAELISALSEMRHGN